MELSRYAYLPSVEAIRRVIFQWWRLRLAVADSEGYVADHTGGKVFPSGNDFCQAALHSKLGFKKCNKSIAQAAKSLPQMGRSFVHRCHLGFDIVSVPIVASGQKVGFVFTGGNLQHDLAPDEQGALIRKAEEILGRPPIDAHGAIEGIPRLGAADMERLADLLSVAADEIGKSIEASGSAGEFPKGYVGMIGSSGKMGKVFDLVTRVAKSEATVLIHGESGTGKELIARAIHRQGGRADKPFIVQNCSALNDNLLESALFGHVKGAFTNASEDRGGLFQAADGGTFFLDEIGDMSPALQVKLLRVLQEGTITPVGSTVEKRVDVRIVAASHKDLGEMVKRGEFREDLFYRVNVIRVELPPLRERVDDIPDLVNHFVKKFVPEQLVEISPAAIRAMQRYTWPGNIRELENEVERALVLAGAPPRISLELLSGKVTRAQGQTLELNGDAQTQTLRHAVEALEADVIFKGLIRTHWNKSQLAKELGISRSSLIQKCAQYGLEKKRK